jgi:hypothetical protein
LSSGWMTFFVNELMSSKERSTWDIPRQVEKATNLVTPRDKFMLGAGLSED